METVSHFSAKTLPHWLPLVRDKVERLRFAVIQHVVHEGRIMPIECTERPRLAAGWDAQRAI